MACKESLPARLCGKSDRSVMEWSMFCPYCGTPEQNPKSYCRRCGEWLAPLSSKPQQRMKVMMVFNALNSLMALFAAVVLYATYLGTPEIKWSVYVGAALCSVIAVHQMISFAFALELRLRSRRIDKELTPAAPGADAGFVAQIEGRDTNRILNMPSVTEDTTATLQDAPRATTKSQD